MLSEEQLENINYKLKLFRTIELDEVRQLVLDWKAMKRVVEAAKEIYIEYDVEPKRTAGPAKLVEILLKIKQAIKELEGEGK